MKLGKKSTDSIKVLILKSPEVQAILTAFLEGKEEDLNKKFDIELEINFIELT